jgi:transposase
MNIDLSQPAPRVRTIDQAQALIDSLWSRAQGQARQIAEQACLIANQARQIELLNQRIATLEEKLRINSRNSSTPPSSDPHRAKAPAPRSGKKRGAQPGHPGKARALLPPDQVTEAHDCRPGPCPACGGAVKITGLAARHQMIDLPPVAPVVTEYRLFAGRCRACGQACEAALPPGVSRRVTGPRLLAAIGALTGAYHLSKRQTQGVLTDLFGIDLSVGAISESEAEIGDALAGIAAEAHAHVQAAAVVHADETGHKQCGARHWLWLVATCCVAVFLAAATRSEQAARAALGERFAGILVSDRYGAYAWIEAQRRQLCWAHLLRDFTKIAERGGASARIGDELVALTQRMFACWHRVRDGTMSRQAFGFEMPFLRHRIETLLQEGATCRHPQTAGTCRHILGLRAALWTFIDTPGVEPTNNHAERNLRRFVIWRKISFGTQSVRGSRYVERIMTVAGSCKLQGRNVLDFLTQAIQAHWGHGIAPSLVPA